MGKRIRYKYKDRKGIASLFNSKGYPRGKKGQPKLNQEILVGLIAKIKMNKKITPYKAWIETTKDKNFPWILEQHYKNKKGNAAWWITRFQNEPDTKKNFWRNHLQAHFNKKVSD